MEAIDGSPKKNCPEDFPEGSCAENDFFPMFSSDKQIPSSIIELLIRHLENPKESPVTEDRLCKRVPPELEVCFRFVSVLFRHNYSILQ